MLHNEPTEKSALIKKEKKALSTIIYNNLSHYTPIAGQVMLGGIGLGAGFLYAGPATTCAQAPTCGLWLSNLISEKAAIGVFFAGGLDFAGINAYFSSESIKNYSLFISTQSSWPSKLGWGTAIIVYTGAQGISSYLSSISTNSKPWQTAITVAGATPGNLYTAVGTAQYGLPSVMTYILNKYRVITESVSDLCITPGTEERLAREQRIFYSKQHADFLKSIDRRWKYIKAHPRKQIAHADVTPRSHLLSANAADPQGGFLRYTAKKSGQVVAMGMSTAISVPFIINNFHTINEYVPHVPAGLLTTFFSYSFIYSNVILCMNFVDGVLKILDNVASGNPIDSLVFQLHPYITIGAMALILAGSTLSFALMNTIYEMVFPQENPTREAFRYISDISIVLYHIAGLYHLYELLLSKLSYNTQDRFLFQIEDEVAHFNKMTLEDFKTFVETNSPAENQRLGLCAFPFPASLDNAETGTARLSQSPAALFSNSEIKLPPSPSNDELIPQQSVPSI